MLSQHSEQFNLVCQIAKNKDQKALTEIEQKGICIANFLSGHSPVITLAKEGNKEAVDFLIQKFNASINDAVYGYAFGGYFDQVNELIARGATHDDALCGYTRGEHITSQNILRLMSCTKDKNLRALVVDRAKAMGILNSNINELKTKAEKNHLAMHEYQLNYGQLSSLATPGARTWLLQGTQLVQSDQCAMISDTYFKISSMLLGLSSDSTKLVFRAVHKQLFTSMYDSLTTGICAWWRGDEETKKLVDEERNRCASRLIS